MNLENEIDMVYIDDRTKTGRKGENRDFLGKKRR